MCQVQLLVKSGLHFNCSPAASQRNALEFAVRMGGLAEALNRRELMCILSFTAPDRTTPGSWTFFTENLLFGLESNMQM